MLLFLKNVLRSCPMIRFPFPSFGAVGLNGTKETIDPTVNARYTDLGSARMIVQNQIYAHSWPYSELHTARQDVLFR